MEKFTAEQNFRLTQAIDWIDPFAAGIFDSDDSSSTDFVLNAEDSNAL